MVLSVKKWVTYAVFLVITLGLGGLSALLTRNAMVSYESIKKAPLTPPSSVFPFVWTVLFILMAVGAAMVYLADDPGKTRALVIFTAQLIVNFFWSIFFFNFQAYLFSFFWLLLLLGLIIAMIVSFYKINKTAALLQIPYLLWVTFAGYLNYMVWFLNR